MSGSLSVPFTFASVFADVKSQKIGWAILAIVAGGFAAFSVWKDERIRRNETDAKLAVFADAAPEITLVLLRGIAVSLNSLNVEATVFTRDETAFRDGWTLDVDVSESPPNPPVRETFSGGAVVADHKFPANQRSTLSLHFKLPPSAWQRMSSRYAVAVGLRGTDHRGRPVAWAKDH